MSVGVLRTVTAGIALAAGLFPVAAQSAHPDVTREREVWGSFPLPDNGWMPVIDTLTSRLGDTFQSGRAILHPEATPHGETEWVPARDDDKVLIHDSRARQKLAGLPAASVRGIFLTSRAFRTGF